MRIFSKRVKLLLAFAVVFTGALLGVVNFTEVCRLEAVTLNDETIDDWRRQFDMLNEKSVFRQPLDSLTQVLLAKEGIFKVDISYSWPHTLDIRTNTFAPVCFVLDKTSGMLYGLDRDGRLIPLENAALDWERPVLTGVNAGSLLGYCEDVRVKVIVDQLERLHRNRLDFYRLLDEIDFEATDYVQVSITGLPFGLKVRAEQFLEGLNRFVDFITRFNPDLEGVRRVDLRFDDMIICARGKI